MGAVSGVRGGVLTWSCASARTIEALTVATSSSEIFSCSLAGAVARFLDLGFVDVLGADRHVGEDRDAGRR